MDVAAFSDIPSLDRAPPWNLIQHQVPNTGVG